MGFHVIYIEAVMFPNCFASTLGVWNLFSSNKKISSECWHQTGGYISQVLNKSMSSNIWDLAVLNWPLPKMVILHALCFQHTFCSHWCHIGYSLYGILIILRCSWILYGFTNKQPWKLVCLQLQTELMLQLRENLWYLSDDMQTME